MARPGAGIAHLSASLQTILRERLNVPVAVWAVAASEQWDKTVVTQLLANLPERDRDILLSVRTHGIWLELNEDVVVNAAAECGNAATAAQLGAYLEVWAKPLFERVRTVADGVWVAGQAHTTAASLQQALDPLGAKVGSAK